MVPTAYEELLIEAQPQVLDTHEQYDEANRRMSGLIRRGPKRTPEETKLMRLLGLLIADYDRKHAMPPEETSAAERLQFLMEHSGKKPTDLLAVFGQRSHVNEALDGKRPISAPQARKLGEMFRVNPGLFI